MSSLEPEWPARSVEDRRAVDDAHPRVGRHQRIGPPEDLLRQLTVRGDDRRAQLRPLPSVLEIGLRHREIVAASKPIFEAS